MVAGCDMMHQIQGGNEVGRGLVARLEWSGNPGYIVVLFGSLLCLYSWRSKGHVGFLMSSL